MNQSKRFLLCDRAEAERSEYVARTIEYRKSPSEVVVFIYRSDVYAYINLCPHAQRPLDCEQASVFDAGGELLRCSMHGFVFEPTTGECLSPVCAGQRLKALKIADVDGKIYSVDKHARPAP